MLEWPEAGATLSERLRRNHRRCAGKLLDNLLANAVWDLQASLAQNANYIPSTKLPAIQAAALAVCDSRNGASIAGRRKGCARTAPIQPL